MRRTRSSVRRFVVFCSIFLVILNTYAIYHFISSYNVKNDAVTIEQVSEIPTNNNVLRKDVTRKRPSKHTFDVKSFYNREHLADDMFGTDARLDVHFQSRKLLVNSSDDDNKTTSVIVNSNYPKDIFTEEQKKKGFIVFHVIGVCYMFLGLAIICDDFFVPSLHIISKMLDISDDVAGATFMAAGGSAPELFVSIIGVFISVSNVGFGTIVGSAVFNVLFVIGMCAMFSKAILSLTWWPLLRDCIFYIIALIILIVFFQDESIEWYEALILLLVYVCYVIFMAFNEKTEAAVKNFLQTNTRCFSTGISPIQLKAGCLSSSDLKRDVYANGAVQLAIHTLDPIAEDPVDEKFRRMRQHSTATPTSNIFGSGPFDGPCDCGRCSTCSSIIGASSPRSPILTRNNAHNNTKKEQETEFQGAVKDGVEVSPPPYPRENMVYNIDQDADEDSTESYHNNGTANNNKMFNAMASPYSTGDIDLNNLQDTQCDSDKESNTKNRPSSVVSNGKTCTDSRVHGSRQFSRQSGRNSSRSRSSCHSHRGLFIPAKSTEEPDTAEIEEPTEEEEEEEGPIDFSIPESCGGKIYYFIKLPLILLFSITTPDVRRPKLWKLFPLTFIMSIVWIAILSYLMAWWATEIGKVTGIPDEVMGLTFLAAGTSIPDLITSVVVARQGHGDMAVSSSIGSNIFDITVGLPFPWLLKSLIDGREPVSVVSRGLFCSTILLFIMLFAILITIAVNKWKMTKVLGFIMFGLYLVFITITLLIQLDVFACPL